MLRNKDYEHQLSYFDEMHDKITESSSLEYMLKNFNQFHSQEQKVDEELKMNIQKKLSSINKQKTLRE